MLLLEFCPNPRSRPPLASVCCQVTRALIWIKWAGVFDIELTVIAWVQWWYMDAPPSSAAAKVLLLGGANCVLREGNSRG